MSHKGQVSIPLSLDRAKMPQCYCYEIIPNITYVTCKKQKRLPDSPVAGSKALSIK